MMMIITYFNNLTIAVLLFVQCKANIQVRSWIPHYLISAYWEHYFYHSPCELNADYLVCYLEIDQYGFFGADTDISKICKSCLLIHYQKYNEFYALCCFKNLQNQDLW